MAVNGFDSGEEELTIWQKRQADMGFRMVVHFLNPNLNPVLWIMSKDRYRVQNKNGDGFVDGIKPDWPQISREFEDAMISDHWRRVNGTSGTAWYRATVDTYGFERDLIGMMDGDGIIVPF